MADAALPPDTAAPPARPRAVRGLSWIAKFVTGFALVLAFFIAALVAFLDTGPGHRLIVDRIAAMTPRSGLRIRIGRIEGSIWGRTRLRDVRLYDPDGLFAEASRVDMDWRPVSFLFNRLLIHELESELVTLHRLPDLIEADEPGPILPDYDIHVGRLDILRLNIGRRVAGREQAGRVSGEAEIRAGRALIGLDVAIAGEGDRLRLRLDAEPERDRFQLEARVRAPANSFIGALAGTRRPLRADLAGEGSWRAWRGRGTLDLSGRRAADIALTVASGRYRLRGWAAPAPFLGGKLQRLSAPRIALDGRGTVDGGRVNGRLSMRSGAMRLEGRGGLDLRRRRYERIELAASLLRPAALFGNMSGRDVRGAALLDGPFASAELVYRLTAPRIAFDTTGFDEVRAAGRGRIGRSPTTLSLAASARRLTGIGEQAEDILAELRLAGQLRIAGNRLTGEDLRVDSRRLRGPAGLAVDLRTGVYAITAQPVLAAYPVRGFGLVDVNARLMAVPGAGRRGTQITGDARAAVRRLDNRFLAWLGGGLPRLQTRFSRGPDRILAFSDMRIDAPDVALLVRGHRRRDGTFDLAGAGRHRRYGPMRIGLDGRLERPRLAVRLDAPVPALGLADVLLNLEPSMAGFAWAAQGGSTLGPFRGRGAILLPSGQPAIIQVAALDVSGTTARGALRSDSGGFSGNLDVAGGGLEGRLAFAPFNGVQRIAVDLDAEEARFAGPPAIVMRRGTIEGVVLLDPRGTSLEGRVEARGLSRGPLNIARLDAQGSLRGGSGRITARIAGSRGRDFAFSLAADVAPGRYRVSGSGTLDRRPLALAEPAELSWTAEGWRLAPTRFTFAGGEARLAGLFGDRTEIDARLETMPLSVLDMAWPRLGLGGIATGLVRYRSAGAGAPPAGEANLRVRGLTRAGLVLASRPVDIGVNARLDGVNAALRAVAVSEGRTIGRAQARISPIGGAGSLYERLAGAPMRAQLRYNGAADTLWRLTGIELLDLSGPAAIGADISGTLDNPRINGLVRAAGARLESAVTGLVIENLQAEGRFGGARLNIGQFRGTTPGGGRVSGTGSLDFAAPRGVGMSFDLEATNARLLDRDDIAASVTGPLTIRSDGQGGTIAGRLRADSARFTLGSATAAAQVARLPVREINRPDADLAPSARRIDPWRLALEVSAPERLMVTGLGMNSEWSADLRVAGTVTEPRITGRAELLRGSYDFAGRRFDLIRGDIRFQGESPVNPQLDIAAEARVRGLNAQIRVSGRSQRPEIAFTSTPALPQDELLSRILFGTSITNLSAPEAIQLAAAVASLNDPRGGLDPINALRRSIGLDRLRILPADVTQGIGTQFAAGKYFGRRVYVEVVTDARGYSATTVEYQISRWLSLLSTISTVGRESANVRVSRDY